MPKVLYVATVVKTHIMEFHIPYLKMLKELGWETAVAARNDYEDPSKCLIPYCDYYYDIPFERNPLKLGNIKAYYLLKKVIDNGGYDIIHCHTPVGAMLTRLAASSARKKGSKLFYTAHGFHFYKGAPFVNWIFYYPVEKFLARNTDVLITITKEDFQRAKSFKSKSVEYVPGVGVDLNRFKKDCFDKSKKIRVEFGIPLDAIVLLSVGEVNVNKNHKVVIQVLPYFPNVWYIICGYGPLMEEHQKLAESLGVNNRFAMAGYRTDVVDFYNMADVFVFPSLREGLPLALMEAMACGLVCVASRNRGTDDLLKESNLLFEATSVYDLNKKLKIAINEDCTKEIKDNFEQLKVFSLENTLYNIKLLYMRELIDKS